MTAIMQGRYQAPAGRVSHATGLYRAYDVYGRLLYVGISNDVNRRMTEHEQQSGWYGQRVYTTVTGYPTRLDALAAEAIAICSERPSWNKAAPAHDKTACPRCQAAAAGNPDYVHRDCYAPPLRPPRDMERARPRPKDADSSKTTASSSSTHIVADPRRNPAVAALRAKLGPPLPDRQTPPYWCDWCSGYRSRIHECDRPAGESRNWDGHDTAALGLLPHDRTRCEHCRAVGA